jgi:uncharacterized membrane protein
MSEAAVVNLFLTLRVLLVGGILLILPRITRKGLLFGVYVGEERAEGDEARRLLHDWNVGCVALMAVALVVGLAISVAGWPVAGNLTGTAVLLLAALGLYVRMYSRARALVPPGAARQAERAAAPLDGGKTKAEVVAMVVLGITLLTGLATAAYALIGYEAMPDRVPAGLFGVADGLSDKSIVAVMFFPSLNLIVSPFFALLALLTATAKRSVRGGLGGRSVEAQDAFRAAMANVVSGLALFICALLTLLSIQIIRIGLGEISSLGVAVWWLPGAMIVSMLAGLIWIIKQYGQGGALLEGGSPDVPLTGGLADDAHWVGGLFYVDRGDPSIMVEKRFGIGYTFNYGNRTALLIVTIFLALILSLAAVGLIGIVF